VSEVMFQFATTNLWPDFCLHMALIYLGVGNWDLAITTHGKVIGLLLFLQGQAGQPHKPSCTMTLQKIEVLYFWNRVCGLKIKKICHKAHWT